MAGRYIPSFSREKDTFDKKYVLRFTKEYIFTHKWYIFVMFCVIAFMQIYSALVPQFTRHLIDNTDLGQSEFLSILITVTIWLLSLLVVRAVCRFISRYYFMVYQQTVEYELRENTFEKSLHLHIQEFDVNNEGWFMSKISRSPLFMAEFAHHIPRNLFEGTMAFAFNITFIFMISWIAGTIAVSVLMISIYLSASRKRKFKANFKNVREAQDNVAKQISNDIIGIRDVKNYNAFDHIYENTLKSIDKELKWRKKDWKLYADWTTSNKLFIGSMTLAFVLVGVYGFLDGDLTLGEISALLIYAVSIQLPIYNFIALYDTYFKSGTAIENYYTFMSKEVEGSDKPEMNIKGGEIVADNLSVRFGDVEVLKNLSFKINSGENIAIVGKTGSGKSTLMKMIMKYYRPHSGSLSIDGQVIDDHSTYSVRSNISYMSQDPFISFDTVRNNILITDKVVSDEEYEMAKVFSNADEFINKLPNKDETMIGPKGITLSGGQRQRLALARIFTLDTKIILFDEATSALDNITEKHVKESIDKFTKDKTVITIAHRLSTIKDAERILVLDNGEIVEDGTWDNLMSKKGALYEYANSIIDEGGSNEN